MRQLSLKFCTLIALVPALLLFQAFAQAPTPVAAPAAAYADEPLVIERSETVVEVAADGTGWKQRTLVARLQADAGVKRYSVLTIQYAGNSQHVEIAYARVTHADGTVVETPPTEAMDMPSAVTRAAPFYSDLKELATSGPQPARGRPVRAEVPHRAGQKRRRRVSSGGRRVLAKRR